MATHPIPADRELDVAVARALGWREIHDTVRGGPIGIDPHFGEWCDLPLFSIDWNQLPVMLRWLASKCKDLITMEWCEDGQNPHGAFPGRSEDTDGPMAEGDTMLLAVCRLVLAVAGREEVK